MVIKRYPNRKLYDTQARKYITLEGVAVLLRKGEEVRVVDYASGDDLTTQVLSQVIAGQEKKRGGFVPRPVLEGLVQAGGATLDGMRRMMLQQLDLFKHVDEEIQLRIETLIQQDELTEVEGIHLLKKLLALSPQLKMDTLIEREIIRILAEKGVPTRQDIQHLMEQVEMLTDKLEEVD